MLVPAHGTVGDPRDRSGETGSEVPWPTSLRHLNEPESRRLEQRRGLERTTFTRRPSDGRHLRCDRSDNACHRLGFRFRFVDVDPRDRSLGGVHPSEPHRWTHDVACAQASGCSTRSNAAFSCTFATHCIRHERGCHGGRGHTCIRSSQYLDRGSRDWRCDFHHGSCRNVGGTMGRAAIRKSGGGNRRSMSHRDWSSDLD
jgi:hypothetical protein